MGLGVHLSQNYQQRHRA